MSEGSSLPPYAFCSCLSIQRLVSDPAYEDGLRVLSDAARAGSETTELNEAAAGSARGCRPMGFDLSRAVHGAAQRWRKIACNGPGKAAGAVGKGAWRAESARVGVGCVHAGVALEDAPDVQDKRAS